MTIVLSAGHPLSRGGAYQVALRILDEAVARAFLARIIERADTHRRIAVAVAEYETRVARDEPYEEGLDAAQIRERYGA